MPRKATSKNKLDAKTRKYYQKLLLDLKEKILGDIKKISNDAANGHKENGDVSGHPLHMADVATDMYDREFSLGLAANEREMLQKIDEALVRLGEGTYGICTVTGRPISKARLKAVPYVETCLEAQEEIDQKNARLPR